MLKYLSIILIFFIVSCTTSIDYNGQKIDRKLLKKIKTEKLNSSQIINLIGYPSFKSEIDQTKWFYSYQELRKTSFQKPKTIDIQIVEIGFDTNMNFQNLKEYNEQDLIKINQLKDKTISGGTKINPLQQLYRGVQNVTLPKKKPIRDKDF